MTDDELKQTLDSFIAITKGVLAPRRTMLSWLFGNGAVDSYDVTVRLQTQDKIEYEILLPGEPYEVASRQLFYGFGERLSREREVPENIIVARMILMDKRDALVIECCARNRRWIRGFIPLARDRSNSLRVAGDPIYETCADETSSDLQWNAASEVMQAFLDKA